MKYDNKEEVIKDILADLKEFNKFFRAKNYDGCDGVMFELRERMSFFATLSDFSDTDIHYFKYCSKIISNFLKIKECHNVIEDTLKECIWVR